MTAMLITRKPVAILFLFLAGMIFIVRGMIWEGLGWGGLGDFLIVIGVAFIVSGIVVWRVW